MVWGEPPASLTSRLPTPQTHVVVCKDGGGGGALGSLIPDSPLPFKPV